mgnify:CR=1 FL=1
MTIDPVQMDKRLEQVRRAVYPRCARQAKTAEPQDYTEETHRKPAIRTLLTFTPRLTTLFESLESSLLKAGVAQW